VVFTTKLVLMPTPQATPAAPKKLKLNVALLNKIKKHILAHPLAFHMGTWGSSTRKSEATPCGTVACIAGWACYLSPKGKTFNAGFDIKNPETAEYAAPKLLGISRRLSQELFFIGNWPRKYVDAYCELHTELEYAEIAASVIDSLIKNGGEKL
jgi:hypothetical protein